MDAEILLTHLLLNVLVKGMCSVPFACGVVKWQIHSNSPFPFAFFFH